MSHFDTSCTPDLLPADPPLSFTALTARRGLAGPAAGYFSTVGVDPGTTGVPQRGQWVELASRGFLQYPHAGAGIVGAAGCGFGVCSVSGSAPIPFLNSFMDFPSDFARSGSLLPPNSTRTITRMSKSSWLPMPNMSSLLYVVPRAAQSRLPPWKRSNIRKRLRKLR